MWLFVFVSLFYIYVSHKLVQCPERFVYSRCHTCPFTGHGGRRRDKGSVGPKKFHWIEHVQSDCKRGSLE